MRKRICGLMLAMAMILFPTMVNAAGTLQDKITNANNGDTITLDKSYSEDIVIPAGKEITINLGNFTLESNGGHTITNKGTLTLEGNGTVTNTVNNKAPIFNDEGTLTIKSGTYKRVNSAGNSFYVILNHGEMTIDGGNISTENGISSLIDNGWYTPSENVNGTIAKLTINGGTFSMINNNKYIKNDDFGQMIINGGIFNMEKPSSAIIASLGTAASSEKVEVNGGEFTYTGTNSVIWDYVKQETGAQTTQINGGTYNITEEGAKISNAEVSENMETVVGEDGKLVVKVKGADYTKVDELLDQAEELDLSKYTDESVKTLRDAVDAIVYNLDYTKQNEVDKMASDLETAIKNLKEKPVVKKETTEEKEEIENPDTSDNALLSMTTLVISVAAISLSSLYLKKRMN